MVNWYKLYLACVTGALIALLAIRYAERRADGHEQAASANGNGHGSLEHKLVMSDG